MVANHGDQDLINLDVNPETTGIVPETQQTVEDGQHSQSTESSIVSDNLIIPSLQCVAQMELAAAELQRTIDEAQAALEQVEAKPRILQSHVDAIRDDLELLASFTTDDDQLRAQVTQNIFRARRIKRDLQRKIIEIDADEPSSNQQVFQLVSPDQRSAPSIKLAPLKAPTFDGTASQFPVFKEFFEENILKNSQIPATAKWLRLKESLAGQPADIISEIPQSAQTLTIAWKLLTDTYSGDDRPVVETYERLQRLQPATTDTVSLRTVYSKLEGLMLSLKLLGQENTETGYIRWMYMSKFPSEIIYQVCTQRSTPLSEIRVAINNLILAREGADQQLGGARGTETRRQLAPQKATASVAEQFRAEKRTAAPYIKVCAFCGADHWNDSCPNYTTRDIRLTRITGKCARCLRRTHTGTPCIKLKKCYHCQSEDHNRALCPHKFGAAAAGSATVHAAAVNVTTEKQRGYFLAFVTQAFSTKQEQPVEARVVIDSAGGSTVARKETTQQLKLVADKTAGEAYTGLGDTQLITSYQLDEEITLRAQDGTNVSIKAEMVNWIIPDVPVADVEKFRREHPEHNNIHIPPTGEGRPIDILIGSDMLVEILEPKPIIKVDDDTFLMPTKFGYLIAGRETRKPSGKLTSLLFQPLKHPLQQMCDLDLVGLAELHDTDIDQQQRAIQSFYDTIQFLENRYSISWPWRCYPPLLDSNFGLALGRLKSLYRRLKNTPKLLTDYDEIILKQLQQGIIEKVDLHAPTGSVVHYVPHHPVIQPGKSTAVRPVYDGSSKSTTTKKSLNENILKGKNWLNDLAQTLLRFRRFKNVAVADISKAFHQISINEQDRDAVRFLWLKNPAQPPTNDNLQAYRFTRVAFGVVASPFILSATIQYHASKQEKNAFVEVLLQDMYADNLVTSFEENIDPKKFYDYAKNFFGTMSMDLTKWTSNIEELLQYIPQEDQVTEAIQSILGLKWNRIADTLSIKQPKQLHSTTPTRRTVASEMASYFDPLGWATPVVLLARNFFRKVWAETDRWDEPLSTERTEEWREITYKLQKISTINLPRQLPLFAGEQQIQLHTFVDASAAAYAVTVYIRVQQQQQTRIALVAARNRLTPLKTVTIPKLELVAILLGSRYAAFVKEAMRLTQPVQTVVWSDSQCALTWMQQQKLLPSVIEKYITAAKTYKIDQYRYVPSEQNYADIATRGADVETLQQMQWWQGPSWLLHEENWPTNVTCNQKELQTSLIFQQKLMSVKQVVTEEEKVGVAKLRIQSFSTLARLLKRTAVILKALVRLMKKNFHHLQADMDTQTAIKLWLRWDQNREYAVQDEPAAGKEFPLRNISVFRDDDGLIRCSTRITNSCQEIDTLAPILLVKNSTLTRLIIMQIHEEQKHAGTNHTLARVRQKYWLPHGRRQVQKVIINNCYKCRKSLSKAYPVPPPAPLPEFRVLRTQKPFQTTGVDIFGPFLVKHYIMNPNLMLRVEKRWVMICTCATIRAIHLEVLSDMTTYEISFAFRKFVARRGTPKKIISDNAAQFHTLDGHLTDLWKTFVQQPSVTTYFAETQILWEFTPELAPWMGAIYERLIKSVKTAFERTYGNKTLESRQFELAVTEIEAVINARPISYVEQDPELKMITPSDFLTSTYTAIPIQPTINHADSTLEKLWKSSQACLDEFWKYWADQYLLLLRDRNDQIKKQKHHANCHPEKGDIVVMIDTAKRRASWQLAVVERLIRSHDGEVRSVQIRLAERVRMIRPVIMLAPLRLKMDLPEVHDEQLTAKRDAIIVWSPEDDIQENQPILHQNPDISDDEINQYTNDQQQIARITGYAAVEHSYAKN